MGYYTHHELKTSDEQSSFHKGEISKEAGYSGLFEDQVKWYGSSRDMIAYSAKHPNILFTLNGEGEESGDLWVGYYKNGKEQREDAVITYPSFDESKLT